MICAPAMAAPSSWSRAGASPAVVAGEGDPARRPGPEGDPSSRPIYLIVQENRSFDHYFGTYPGADGDRLQGGKPSTYPGPSGPDVLGTTSTADLFQGGPESNALHADIAESDDGFIRVQHGGDR